jgi:hypothetical protein
VYPGATHPSGFFLKKKPPLMLFAWALLLWFRSQRIASQSNAALANKSPQPGILTAAIFFLPAKVPGKRIFLLGWEEILLVGFRCYCGVWP